VSRARSFVVLLLLTLAGAKPAAAQLAPGDPATQFQLTDWGTGLNAATDIAFLADGRALVTRKTGEVVLLAADGSVLQPMAGMFTVDTGSEKGLLGVVRDGDALYFYASTGPTNADKHRVYRAHLGADNKLTVELDKPIVGGNLEGPANHDGGGLFVHKGQLYISVGDTGSNATPPQNKYGECLNKPNGKILRVNLDGSIPGDNPLVGVAMATGCATETSGNYQLMPPEPRIYAWGLRNPWRFWIDPQTDLLWIGDVGEITQEEITVGGKGTNHGWPFNEGTVKYPMPLGGLSDCTQMTPAVPCTPPQDTYEHSGNAASITGGLIPPTGCGWGAYEQRYFFGDYNRNVIWTLDVKPDRTGAVPGSRKMFATSASPVSFRMGPDGALYVVSNGEGSVKRLVPKGSMGCAAAPAPDGGGVISDAGGTPSIDGQAAIDAGLIADGPSGGPGSDAGAGTTTTGSSGCSCNFGPRRGGASMLALIALALLARRRRSS
jgi:glucose/arabinose dehydrogenase